MTVVALPPAKIVQGEVWSQEYLWEAGDAPVDLTGWTGEFLLSHRPFDAPFHRDDIAIIGSGLFRTTIAKEDTAEFEVLPRVKGGPNAYLQIRLTDPLAENNQVWQGIAIIQGVWE